MTHKVYTPLRYPGGKSKVYSYIKELVKLNQCTTYIEPYAGGAGVAVKLLLNRDVEKIMINDFDKSIYAFWYSVLYHTDELITKIQSVDICIEEWYRQKEIQKIKEETEDLLELGFSTLFLNRVNHSGIIKGGVIGGKSQSGNYKMDCRFNKDSIVERIKEIAKHKKSIKIYNLDAEEFIKKSISRTKKSFTFFDPPYYEKGPGLYTNFYKPKDHESLVKTIEKYMAGKKWIVTYDCNINIGNLYSDYESYLYYLNYSVTKPSKGIEYIFFSKETEIGDIEKFLQLA
ncbi:DNA adenine methylase [Streptococcus mutans]|uniref:DNA adenine methylase n=1 Tax=Streptococcus mutans TaxID=1309 RepID=UPI001454EE27|nr:DNA adenine methylase [Streptococcus mutans]MCB4974887.1 DNA adenine methylase [Streptococcus mutans]MCB5021894.1 DNA adenine methylase [Streptococcus mutans]NLQ77040.1 DNA adenine methylase [Streptococcus mutans]